VVDGEAVVRGVPGKVVVTMVDVVTAVVEDVVDESGTEVVMPTMPVVVVVVGSVVVVTALGSPTWTVTGALYGPQPSPDSPRTRSTWTPAVAFQCNVTTPSRSSEPADSPASLRPSTSSSIRCTPPGALACARTTRSPGASCSPVVGESIHARSALVVTVGSAAEAHATPPPASIITGTTALAARLNDGIELGGDALSEW
jgi:hypothetical protein